eukprot:CAMPEP_0170489564 /NCGR_PEP_ID=MMETSP0208-20121228/7910_1 /TAXON_ID=197538 /ORGANISM="Strombidium inclinatum, Strain S3" /LENGTH=130 /DNA_ID=CAMNT_0010764549 /DNA_START=367 /DNA_END=756 /DNA_ORIENTATION=-
MITEEFGGETRVFSKHEVGAAFQSSFEIAEPVEEHDSNTFKIRSKMSSERCGSISYKQKLNNNRNSANELCFLNLKSINNNPVNYPFSKKKILVVDDEPFNCQALVSIFQVLKLDRINEVVDIALSGKKP